jgi:hypothetical protein
VASSTTILITLPPPLLPHIHFTMFSSLLPGRVHLDVSQYYNTQKTGLNFSLTERRGGLEEIRDLRLILLYFLTGKKRVKMRDDIGLHLVPV